MPINESISAQLQNFFNQSDFAGKGGVITDLDGTAIHEYQGRYLIPQSVELGLKKIYDLGRPVVINTLRFPYSVMRTFGKEWYKISNAPIPTVLMNGSQLGFITEVGHDKFGYEEIEAFPLNHEEINNVLKIITDFLKDGLNNLLVFYYPRNWQLGEIIWTPVTEKVKEVQQKYLSASTVFSNGVSQLEEELKKQDICMIFLLIDIPQDKLMAYQHTKKSNFFTHTGVDKRSGSQHIADHLGFELQHSLGAGDSEMDTFLTAVGQAVHIGNPYLQYEGLLPSIRLESSKELGDLLFQLAAMQRTVIQ
jgi:hydroxymethylpyrimidine pyrophosphatase-like HAD family hydrolase